MPAPKYLRETETTRSGEEILAASGVVDQIRDRLAADGFRVDDVEDQYGELYQVTYRIYAEGAPGRVTLTQLRPLIRGFLLQHLREVLRQAYSLELSPWQVRRVRDTYDLLERDRPGATRYVSRAAAYARDSFPDLSQVERQMLEQAKNAAREQQSARRPRVSAGAYRADRRAQYRAANPVNNPEAQEQALGFYALKLSKLEHYGRRVRVELWQSFERVRDAYPDYVASEWPALADLKRTTFYRLLEPHLDSLIRRDVGWTFKPGEGALRALVSHGHDEAANRLQRALDADQPDRRNS